MAYPPYIREKARQMRVERAMSLDEIAERLALPKTTVWYWIKDLPLNRPRRASPGQQKGNRAMQGRWRQLREEAYAEGRGRFPELLEVETFRDFVCLYMAEGYKRSRNAVALANSDPAIIELANAWIRREARRKVWAQVQFHADQDPAELQRFWGEVLGMCPEGVRLVPKGNSARLSGRTWRCEHGVLTVGSSDTYFRARLQAWMDCLKESWAYTWADQPGRSAAW